MLEATYQTLSDRERDVFCGLVLGLSNQDIGDVLGISIKTVKFHATNIYEKFNVGSVKELLSLYIGEYYEETVVV